jgi:hypothetical protein
MLCILVIVVDKGPGLFFTGWGSIDDIFAKGEEQN